MGTEAGGSLQAICFGAPTRRLFAVYQPGVPAAQARPAVLLCNAFGQEAIRSHRLMRVLMERLAREGHPVMRFDYFGTGDSMGDDLDGDLDGWAGDVLQADAELRRRSASDATIWLGIRLGASVALRAAHRAPTGLQRLVLFDAVLNGQLYLAHLRERHVVSLEAAYSILPRPAPHRLARDPSQFRDEAIGFALSPTLRAQIAALGSGQPTWPERPASIVALSDPDGPDGQALFDAALEEPERVRALILKHGTDWTRDTADNTALVPTQALLALVQQVGASA